MPATADDVCVDPAVEQAWPLSIFLSEQAQLRGEEPELLAESLLFEPRQLEMPDGKTGRTRLCRWIPSTRFGCGLPGPCRVYDVVCVGKMPRFEDTENGRNFTGSDGQVLESAAREAGLDVSDWYVVNAVRHYPPDGGKRITDKQMDECAWLTGQDIAQVRPRVLVLLGADAVRAVCGKKTKLGSLRSLFCWFPSVADMRKPPAVWEGQQDGILVFTTINPSAVLYEGGLREGFVRDLSLLAGQLNTSTTAPAVPVSCDYRYVHAPFQLKTVVDELLAAGVTELAIDCEWGGGEWHEGRLRSVQFSWAERKACVAVLLGEGGVEVLEPSEKAAMVRELHRLFTAPGMGLIGHHYRADAPWLEELGIPVTDRLVDDTMLMDHILNENAEHGLENLAVRFTDMGRYDLAVTEWMDRFVEQYPKKDPQTGMKLSKDQIRHRRGYWDVPEDLLLVYAARDCDATFRCRKVLRERLSRPENVRQLRLYEDIVLPANAAVAEAEKFGLLADQKQLEEMTGYLVTARERLLEKARETASSPALNPRSSPQVAKLLFGPPEEGGLGLEPYKTSGKPAQLFEDLKGRLDADEIAVIAPSTDGETLEFLSTEHPAAEALLEFRMIDKLITGFLSTDEDIDGGKKERLSDKTMMANVAASDGRVRSHYSLTSETGRMKSYRPNLQNASNRREEEYKRILGDQFRSLRGCFIASPGFVLVASDYQSAEVFTLGRLAGCEKLIQMAPVLHAVGAVKYLKAPPWKGIDELKKPPEEWLKANKVKRTGAKTINFGIPYQLGAKGLARKITRDTKRALTPTADEAQQFINSFYELFEEVRDYVDYCKQCAIDPGWLENPFGRRRRSMLSGNDEAKQAAAQREFVNFPIQGSVADILLKAISNLYEWRRQYPGGPQFRILNFVHDSIVTEVAAEGVEYFVDEVLPKCMCDGARVPAWHRAKRPPTQPFSLSIDTEVSLRWGSEATVEELRAAGVPREAAERFGSHK